MMTIFGRKVHIGGALKRDRIKNQCTLRKKVTYYILLLIPHLTLPGNYDGLENDQLTCLLFQRFEFESRRGQLPKVVSSNPSTGY